MWRGGVSHLYVYPTQVLHALFLVRSGALNFAALRWTEGEGGEGGGRAPFNLTHTQLSSLSLSRPPPHHHHSTLLLSDRRSERSGVMMSTSELESPSPESLCPRAPLQPDAAGGRESLSLSLSFSDFEMI